jgi:hypothetical protein
MSQEITMEEWLAAIRPADDPGHTMHELIEKTKFSPAKMNRIIASGIKAGSVVRGYANRTYPTKTMRVPVYRFVKKKAKLSSAA